MPRKDYGICIVCNKRKARRIKRTCDPCQDLVEAEGTHRKYGVPKGTLTRQRWQEQAKQYNALIRKGLKQEQIVPIMGMKNLQQLRSAVNRWKNRAGIKVVPGWANQRLTRPKVPKATAHVQQIRNEHGGGRWGVAGCDCDPCHQVRLVSRRLANKRYRKRLKEKREEAKKKNIT